MSTGIQTDCLFCIKKRICDMLLSHMLAGVHSLFSLYRQHIGHKFIFVSQTVQCCQLSIDSQIMYLNWQREYCCNLCQKTINKSSILGLPLCSRKSSNQVKNAVYYLLSSTLYTSMCDLEGVTRNRINQTSFTDMLQHYFLFIYFEI